MFSANCSNDLDSPAPILLGVDLGGPYVLVAQDDPCGLDAEPLPDLGRGCVPQLIGMRVRDACLAASALDRSPVTRDGVMDTGELLGAWLPPLALAPLDTRLSPLPALFLTLQHRFGWAEKEGIEI